MRNIGKRLRVDSADALVHAVGKNFVLVVSLLVLISWFGDTALTLLSQVFDWLLSGKEIPKDYLQRILIGSASLLGLSIFWFASDKAKYSDRFQANIGKNPAKREVMLLVLSPFTPWAVKQDKTVVPELEEAREGGSDRHAPAIDHPKAEEIVNPATSKSAMGYTREQVIENLSRMPQDGSIEDLCKTKFQNNWIPLLRSIELHEGLREIVVITTDTDRGSCGQCADFNRVVQHRFGDHGLRVTEYKKYLKVPEVVEKNTGGISSNDMVEFTNTLLHLMDRVLEKYNKKSDKFNGDKVVVEVTGGMGFMSAVLASASVVNNIEIHYINTHTLKSQSLDIIAR